MTVDGEHLSDLTLRVRDEEQRDLADEAYRSAHAPDRRAPRQARRARRDAARATRCSSAPTSTGSWPASRRPTVRVGELHVAAPPIPRRRGLGRRRRRRAARPSDRHRSPDRRVSRLPRHARPASITSASPSTTSTRRSPLYTAAASASAVEHRETVAEQGVEAVLLDVGESHVELLAPLGPDTPVGKFLAKRGPGLHHVAYQVDDIEAELARLARGRAAADRRARRASASAGRGSRSCTPARPAACSPRSSSPRRDTDEQRRDYDGSASASRAARSSRCASATMP